MPARMPLFNSDRWYIKNHGSTYTNCPTKEGSFINVHEKFIWYNPIEINKIENKSTHTIFKAINYDFFLPA